MKYTQLIFLLILSTKLFAQDVKTTKPFIEAETSAGHIFQTNDFVKGENASNKIIDFYSSVDLRFGWQTLGTKAWHQELNFPYYGVGINSYYFEHEKEIGYPNAVYLFLGAPFKRVDNHSFNYEFSFGLSYDWRPYDSLSNPYNISIGSKYNAYIDLRFFYAGRLHKRLNYAAGIRMNHFSNGATSFPNKGLNMIAPFINFRYNFRNDPIRVNEGTNNDYLYDKEFNFLISYGRRSVKRTNPINSEYVDMINLAFEYLKSIRKPFKYGIVVDLGYNENQNIEVLNGKAVRASVKNRFYTIFNFAGQLRINLIAVQAELGYGLLPNKSGDLSSQLYQRAGLRYYIKNKIIAGVRIKATNFSKADYIEWSLGYAL